jgi:predicted neuraminidase
LCPTSTEYHKEGDTFWQVHFELSKDGGKTWQTVGPINDGVEFDAIQPSILIHPGGKLQALCRTRQNVLVETWSSDGGQSWSALKPSGLPNPNAGADGVTLKDGRHLLVYNHTVSRGEFPSGRNMLNVAISSDGKDWRPVLTLERDKRQHGYSYPSVIQAKDGKVHAVYTWGRVSVRHVVLDVGEIE